jgi:protein-disulfide isomerase
MSKLKEMKKAKEEKKSIDFTLVAVAIAAAMVLFLVYSFVSNPNPQGVDTNIQNLASDDPFTGGANAKVVIVEFSDFQCPACGQAYPVLKQIKADYLDKIKLVYRDFPLSQHTFAFKAAEAANCANEQSQFWAYHDILFENQDNLGADALKQYAADLGLDTAKFNSCLDSGKYAQEVSNDLADGAAAGVSSTPTFFINNKRYSNMPYAQFKQIIDAELAK